MGHSVCGKTLHNEKCREDDNEYHEDEQCAKDDREIFLSLYDDRPPRSDKMGEERSCLTLIGAVLHLNVSGRVCKKSTHERG